MQAWIPRIKQAGFRLGILSNMGDGVLGYMRPRFPWLAQFDHLTWSCELGVVKPDPAIYLHTVKKLNVTPDRALFIDNLQKNIVGAEAVGLNSCRTMLHRRGFPLRRLNRFPNPGNHWALKKETAGSLHCATAPVEMTILLGNGG